MTTTTYTVTAREPIHLRRPDGTALTVEGEASLDLTREEAQRLAAQGCRVEASEAWGLKTSPAEYVEQHGDDPNPSAAVQRRLDQARAILAASTDADDGAATDHQAGEDAATEEQE
jgi:hypothetical protein